jgi:hypothetical protein
MISGLIMLILAGCGGTVKKANKVSETNSLNDEMIQGESGQIDGGETSDPNDEVTALSEDEMVEPTDAELCGELSFNLMTNIDQSVDRLEGTPYSRELKNDCSGIFHQVLDGMRNQCPDAIFPTIENARASRDIAAWYEKNGDFEIVRDPANQDELIQPGAVMFYGYASRASLYDYKTMTIDTLTKRGVGINHVAIVTEVNRDENGVVQSYVIFHGRNKGKPASETVSQLAYDNHPELPAYGNWGEPWLAVADVLVAEN